MKSKRSTVEPLTPRQREVLDLLVEGRTNPEIAQHLGISLDGAKWHVREVLARLEVSSREEAGDYWRRERSPLRRGISWIVPMFAGIGGKAAVIGFVAIVSAAVVGAVLIFGRDDDREAVTGDLTPSPTETPFAVFDDFAPASGIPIVDKVIAIAKAGDLAAFNALMREFPEACSTKLPGVGSPPVCPPGSPDGTLVNTFRAVASERVGPGSDLHQVLANVVPMHTTLYAVVHTSFDRFSGTLPASKYEIVVLPSLGSGRVTGAIYFLDDTGIVGLYAAQDRASVLEHLNGIDPADWIVAPISAARITPAKDLYVLGRDAQIRFDVLLPPACMGKPFGVQLFGYPDPGVAGGIQVLKEPGLNSVLGVAAWTGQSATFNLPATASGPMIVRPGLHSSCLSDVAVQGEIDIALLAPPEDADVAIIEWSGKALDLSRGSGAGTLAEFLTPLAATVNGTVCQTLDTTDRSIRNARGNVVFRIGAADQPPECRAPGMPIVFLFPPDAVGLAGKPLFEKPVYVPGAIQLIRNIGPEGIAN